MTNYPRLFEEVQLGPRVARNRVWMTAHATEFSTDHTYADAHAAYYGERARHGVGVITMEATAVHPTSQPRQGVVLAYDSAVVDSYRRVASAVQPHGALLFAQLWHRGRETDSVVSRHPVWAPSAVPCTVYREIPHVMSSAEIDEIVDGYEISARWAVEGGLDGVEIHGLCHGYLLGQFLSPATNHREDEYGGSEENRFRIVRRIIERVRAVVPDDRVLGIRINGNDGTHEGALSNDDWIKIAERITDLGAVDYVSVAQGTYLDRMLIYGASPKPAAYEVPDTARIKAAVGETPVVAVGRISTPDMAEAIVAAGQADFIGMARQLIADPYWVEKAREDRPNDIRPCVGANHCIASFARSSLSCIHNPAVGREADLPRISSPMSGSGASVGVVGAGPAGLRAAVTAAELGYRVTVFEREARTGGQVRQLATSASYAEWLGITDWLTEQLDRHGGDLRLGSEVTDADLDEFDHVIVATGSQPRRDGWSAIHPARWAPGEPFVSGVDQWNVFTADEVLNGTATMPRSVLIVDDVGDRRALAVAEKLVADGRRDVEIATRLMNVGVGLTDSHDLPSILTRLRKSGVRLTANMELASISEDVVTLADIYNGENETREPVDAVVLITGQIADDQLFHALVERGHPSAVAVGDCVAPRKVFDAIWEGELAARRLTQPESTDQPHESRRISA